MYYNPKTSGIDTLAQTDWKMENNFVNCPFFLIPKVLRVVSDQKAEATIKAPKWPAQTWYRKLLRMSFGTAEKQELEDILLENIWERPLSEAGWSPQVCNQIKYAWSKNTRSLYNIIIKQCYVFCKEYEFGFPPKEACVIADFLCSQCA